MIWFFETESPDNLITKLADSQLENALIIKNGVGIWSLDRTEHSFIETVKFEPKDLTGYTSAIIGAYISCRLKGESRIDSMKYANILGYLQASKTGAIRSIPRKEKVFEALGQYYG